MATLYTDNLIDQLLYKLQQMQDQDEIAQIHNLDYEAATLKKEIRQIQDRLSNTVRLLHSTNNHLKRCLIALDCMECQKKDAEDSWKQYWGIHKASKQLCVEMRCIGP